MEEITEKPNSLLSLLKNTKFEVTSSIVQGVNRLHSNPAVVKFLKLAEEANISTENIILPVKLVKYQVSQQNRILYKRNPQLNNNLKPISSSDLKCLEREIQDLDHILEEKKNIVQSLNFDLLLFKEKKSQLELKLERLPINNVETLADFIGLNHQLNYKYNKVMEITTNLSCPSTKERKDAFYHTYNFHASLFHVMEKMNAVFNEMCKDYTLYNSTVTNSENAVSLEMNIELIGNNLAYMRTLQDMIKCKNYVYAKNIAKIATVRNQLVKGSFKFNALEITQQVMSEKLSKLSADWDKISNKHSLQSMNVYSILCNIHLDDFMFIMNELSQMKDAIKFIKSIHFLHLIIVFLERRFFNVLLKMHGTFDSMFTMLTRQELKLRQIKTRNSSQTKPTRYAELYAQKLIAKETDVGHCNVEEACNTLEEKKKQKEKIVMKIYSKEHVYKTLSTVYERMNCNAKLIYSGPTQTPVLSYKLQNQNIQAPNSELLRVKTEYINLMQGMVKNVHLDSD